MQKLKESMSQPSEADSLRDITPDDSPLASKNWRTDSSILSSSVFFDTNSIIAQDSKENISDSIRVERDIKRGKMEGILFPTCREWIPGLCKDMKEIVYSFLGGTIVGFTNIPIAIAYCIMIDVPITYGIYSLIMPPIFYAFFGSSKQLSVGPESNAFIMIGQSLITLNLSLEDERSGYVLTMTFIMGIVMLIFGISKIGFIENIVSQAIMGGFKVASAIIVFVEILIKMCHFSKPITGKFYAKV